MRILVVKLIRLYILYFPLRSGKIPILRFCSSIGLFNNLEIVSVFDKGIKAKFTVSDWVQQLVFFFGTYIYEKEQVSLWKKLSRKSDVVLDIGSNFGFYSMLSANENRKSKIFAFEPAPMMFQRIGENISLNKFNQIVAVQKGVSDKPGHFEFFVSDDNNTGMSSLVKRSNSKNETLMIDVTSIDSFVKDNSIGKVDLVKIDVEGNEFNVLLGMRDVLKNSKPAVFVELYDENLLKFGHNIKDVFHYMSDLGYVCYEYDIMGNRQIVEIPREFGLAVFLPIS